MPGFMVYSLEGTACQISAMLGLKAHISQGFRVTAAPNYGNCCADKLTEEDKVWNNTARTRTWYVSLGRGPD